MIHKIMATLCSTIDRPISITSHDDQHQRKGFKSSSRLKAMKAIGMLTLLINVFLAVSINLPRNAAMIDVPVVCGGGGMLSGIGSTIAGRVEPADADAPAAKDTYALVVTRCKGNVTWLSDVPSDWSITVYEKCQMTPSTKYSVMTAHQAGKDECNGYLDYIVDHYDDLHPVTVFMHDDGLHPWSKWKGKQAHTPFDSFGQLVNATNEYLIPTQGYITFGVSTLRERFGTNEHHGLAQKMLWPNFQTENMTYPPDKISFKPGAHFAVRRQAIQSRTKSTYEALLTQMRYSKNVPGYLDSRQICCAVERMWHVLFGESPDLPMSTRVTDMMLQSGKLWYFNMDA